MLIDRMRTNPEDFKYGGKLYGFVEAGLSSRDSKVIKDAHDLYIREPDLMVRVLEALLTQPEGKKEEMWVRTQGPLRGTTMNKVWFDELNNTVQTDQQRITREMYEDHIQTHEDHIQTHAKLVQDTATKVTDQHVLSQIYNRTAGRQRIERDN